MSVLPISAIKVGDRSRKDFGDIAGLAESIRTLGLLNPVVVDTNHNLVAGDRRIAAFKSLGLSEIPATVIATLDDARLALAAERDENTCRKEMTPEELFDMAERLRVVEEADAKRRIREAQEYGNGRSKDAAERGSDQMIGAADDEPSWKSETRTKLANTVGMSPATYNRTQQVVNAARGISKRKGESVPEEVQAVAREQLANLNAGKTSATAAAQRVTAAAKKAATPTPAPETPKAPAKYGPRRKHSQVIASAVDAGKGLCIALDEIADLDNSLTDEEAGRLTSDLSTIIRSLKRIQALIKES